MKAEERRRAIAKTLTAEHPVSATALAGQFSVSRQIIVGDIALLRAEAMQIGVCDIAQRGSEISFTFAGADAVPVNAVMALCSLPKNRRRLTLSATGTEPKLLLRLTPNEDALDTALTLVGDLRVNKEENEKEVTL